MNNPVLGWEVASTKHQGSHWILDALGGGPWICALGCVSSLAPPKPRGCGWLEMGSGELHSAPAAAHSIWCAWLGEGLEEGHPTGHHSSLH